MMLNSLYKNGHCIISLEIMLLDDQCPCFLLARLYESTGRAIAITPASALASALLKMLKFLFKVFIRLYLLNMLMD